MTLDVMEHDLWLLALNGIMDDAHAGDFRADKKTPYTAHTRDVAKRVKEKLINKGFDEFSVFIGQAGALLHDVKEDHPEFPLEERLSKVVPTIPDVLVKKILFVVDQMSNTSGGDYLDYLLALKSISWSVDGMIALTIKQADMESNLSDLVNIPHPGQRKGLQTKYILAHYILFGTKPQLA